VSSGITIAQNDLNDAEAIDHGDCHLIPALLTIRECGLGQFECDGRGQGFIGNERILCATWR